MRVLVSNDDGVDAPGIRVLAERLGAVGEVTVVAPDCARANTVATAALVKGDGAVGWLRYAALPARLVSHDGDVATLNHWPREVAA